MTTPAWILDALAGVMLAVAAVSAARLARARPWRRATGLTSTGLTDTEVAHLLMALAMAGMLAGGLRTLPTAAWVIVFGVLTCWFGYRVGWGARGTRGTRGARGVADRHCVPHLVHSGAMVYMFLALPPLAAAAGAGVAGMSGAGHGLRYPSLAFVFALILAAYSVWDLDQLSGGRYRLAAPVAVTVGCRVAMGITMAFMLLIMI